MMTNAATNSTIPDEVFSKSGSQCADAVMSKTFITDVSKVQHHPAVLGLIDLENCYDRYSHGISAIVFRAWKHPASTV